MIDSPYRVPFDGSFRVADAPTLPERVFSKKKAKKQLAALVDRIDDLQERLYAADRQSLLLVFQAMDAAGKDSTIRNVLKGVNPAGFQVFAFKQPSKKELDHDFLWRTSRALPEKGRIGVFNRSHYEEVLVVKVHPEYLGGQRLEASEALWERRYRSIREHEAHLAANNTVVLKFWLNVSRAEQRRRFLARIHDPRKNWKFSGGDVEEAALWDDYMAAYEQALNETSRPGAPWFAIPADDKPTMRVIVADIVARTLEAVDPRFPVCDADALAELAEWERVITSQG